MTDLSPASKLTFATLYSGSSGNCVYIEFDGEAILIDAGKNAKCAETALEKIGGSMTRVRAAFVTHEHSDHVSALDVLSRRYGFPVHAHEGAASRALPLHTVYHQAPIDETVGPFTVRSFYTPHDSGCSMGYTVLVDGRKLGVATDMGMLAKSVVEELCGCEAALIECNYDKEMLQNGPYPPNLKARVGGKFGHLSNEDGALLAAVLARTGATHILLGHLSLENNLPEKALAAVNAEFEKRGVSARVLVAKRDEPTLLLGAPAQKELSC
ncbi:MAG: MBL fold metallo-hydrolase [Clostridia bacterium]|nr:MBL fold metallo-hydrolase [Clostridia bacterium]